MSGLILHHLNNSRSQRILWLLEELGVPYTIKKWERTANASAPKELKAVHPLGVAPVIEDDGMVIAESGAIVDYIIHKYGKDKVELSGKNRIDDVYWSHYAEGSMMPWILMKYIFTLVPAKSPFFLRPALAPVCWLLSSNVVDPKLAQHIKYVENYLEKNSESMWFAHGDGPTSADYMMIFAMEALTSKGALNMPSPKICAWVDAVHVRPAYQRALEKGGQYDYM